MEKNTTIGATVNLDRSEGKTMEGEICNQSALEPKITTICFLSKYLFVERSSTIERYCQPPQFWK
jgi:hypothetical protein